MRVSGSSTKPVGIPGRHPDLALVRSGLVSRHRLHGLDDVLGAIQLSEMQTSRDGPRFDRRKPAGVDHRKPRVMLTAMFCDLPSVDGTGQPDVVEQEVGDLSAAPLQGLLATGRVDHVIPFLSQRFDDELADERLILDDKYAHRRILGVLPT
jgi:hypothetical protein